MRISGSNRATFYFGSMISLTYKSCLLIHEADRISEGVNGIEAAFAPGLRLQLAVNLQARQLSRPLKHGLQIFDGKVYVVWVRAGVELVSISARIKACENDPAAVEVVAAGTDALAWLSQEFAVESRRTLDICNGENDAVKSCHGPPAGIYHRIGARCSLSRYSARGRG
jgi:hypothetical protein